MTRSLPPTKKFAPEFAEVGLVTSALSTDFGWQEFFYGSTYLSHSSRYLDVRADVREVVIFDFSDRRRVADPPLLHEGS